MRLLSFSLLFYFPYKKCKCPKTVFDASTSNVFKFRFLIFGLCSMFTMWSYKKFKNIYMGGGSHTTTFTLYPTRENMMPEYNFQSLLLIKISHDLPQVSWIKRAWATTSLGGQIQWCSHIDIRQPCMIVLMFFVSSFDTTRLSSLHIVPDRGKWRSS